MKAKTLIWVAVAAIAGIAALVFLFSSPKGGVKNVDAAGVRAAADAGAQVVDVRTAGEFQMGHIPGAINVPVDQLETAAASWDRGTAYVIYCATGSRSVDAVQTLERLGFTDIRHFAAGIQAWDGQLERGSASEQKIETAGEPLMIEFFTDA